MPRRENENGEKLFISCNFKLALRYSELTFTDSSRTNGLQPYKRSRVVEL
jgi:hypothetical protein